MGFASLLLLVAGARSVHNATADGETRELSFHHTHSEEDLTIVFKRNGRYDENALKKLNHFLRDWRTQDSITMDRRLFDILWEVNRDVDGKQPIQIISAYRSPETNAMLRRRSSGVARFSQHMQGHAIDFSIPGVPLEQIRFAGLRLQRGGVGFYPESGSPFVHLDVGSIRHWPRMTHEELAEVFPDGRTVHVPSDGTPLAGYQLALADIQKRGDGDAVSANKPGLIASLLSRKPSDDEEEAPAAKPGVKAAVAAVAAKVEKIAESIPLPRAKPAAATAAYQVASAAPQAASAPSPQKIAAETSPPTVVDIINARGFWDNEPVAKPQPKLLQTAALKAQSAADPQDTAGLAPNVAQALAYAPPTPPLDKSQIVASSAPATRGARMSSLSSNAIAASPDIADDKARSGTAVVRVVATQMNEIWLRAMILSPSVSTALLASSVGDQDMSVMRTHFAKPKTAVAMAFSEDPLMGIVCEKFTGPATVTLQTLPLGLQTAALR